MKLRARSNTANAACPSLRWQTSRLEPERREQPPAADAEHELLHEAQIGAAAVELARDAAVRGIVRRVVAVEQVELHPSDLHLPGAQPDGVARQIELAIAASRRSARAAA